MSFEPTPKQALILFGLLARHGKSAQAELMPKVTKADREALVKLRLIRLGEGRPYILNLEDDGWAWVAANLSANLPPLFRTLQDMLRRLNEHLTLSHKTLADFIGEKPVESRSTAFENKSAKPRVPIRKKLEEAYLEISRGRWEENVRLSELRQKLKTTKRATLDNALHKILQGDKTARLLRINDPRAISTIEARAAFNPGGEPFHILWMKA